MVLHCMPRAHAPHRPGRSLRTGRIAGLGLGAALLAACAAGTGFVADPPNDYSTSITGSPVLVAPVPEDIPCPRQVLDVAFRVVYSNTANVRFEYDVVIDKRASGIEVAGAASDAAQQEEAVTVTHPDDPEIIGRYAVTGLVRVVSSTETTDYDALPDLKFVRRASDGSYRLSGRDDAIALGVKWDQLAGGELTMVGVIIPEEPGVSAISIPLHLREPTHLFDLPVGSEAATQTTDGMYDIRFARPTETSWRVEVQRTGPIGLLNLEAYTVTLQFDSPDFARWTSGVIQIEARVGAAGVTGALHLRRR